MALAGVGCLAPSEGRAVAADLGGEELLAAAVQPLFAHFDAEDRLINKSKISHGNERTRRLYLNVNRSIFLAWIARFCLEKYPEYAPPPVVVLHQPR